MGDRGNAQRATDPARPDLLPDDTLHDQPAQGTTAPPPAAGGPALPLATGGFAALLAVRTLTVVDDNLLRWLVIGLGKHAAGVAGTAIVLTVGTAGFVLPFIALAWLAGWLADRHPKRSVIAWCKFAEVLIVAVAIVVLWRGSRPGEAFAGWSRLAPAAATLLAVATAGWLASFALARRPAADPAAPPPFNALARSWADLAELARSRELAATAAGIVYFWALGAVVQLNVDQLVSEGGATAQSQAIPMLLALVSGIGIGSVVAGWISSRGADLGLVPVGIAVTGVASLVLAIGPPTIFASHGAVIPGAWWTVVAALAVLGFGAGLFDVPLEAHFQAVAPPARRGALLAALNLLTFAGMLAASLAYGLVRAPANQPAAHLPPALWLLLGTVVLIGSQAALLAPAVIGSIAETVPPRRLARANGTFALATLAATLAGMAVGNWLADQPPAAAAEAAATPLVSARGVFGFFGGLAAVATAVAVWAAPRASLRILVAAIVHSLWRFRVRDEHRVPAAGPVVMIANHVSYLDGFLMPMSCRRLVRMVVYAPNIPGRFLRMLADQWRFIYFDPRPKSIGTALKAMHEGIAAGDAIGIFCEGGISRHGQVLGFKRGLERILEKVPSPLQPVHIDGLWGSTLSFAGGRFFAKWPRRFRAGGPRGLRRTVTLTYGPVLPAGTPPATARLALQELSATAVRRRFAGGALPAAAADPVAVAATLEAIDGACLLRHGDRLVASLAAGDPLHAALGTAAALAPLCCHTRVVDAATTPADLVGLLAAERATVWIARVAQVDAAAADPGAAALSAHLSAVVMPIGSLAEFAAARDAADRFTSATGVEPVVAYAPREAGGLVAMNTPPARAGSPLENVCKPDSVGRVMNGVVAWPEARMRRPLGLDSLAAQGVPDDAAATLVIGATFPNPGDSDPEAPRAVLLADAFDVDEDGFLVPRG